MASVKKRRITRVGPVLAVPLAGSWTTTGTVGSASGITTALAAVALPVVALSVTLPVVAPVMALPAVALPVVALPVFLVQVLGIVGARRRGAGDREVGVGKITTDGLTSTVGVGVAVALAPVGVLVGSFLAAAAGGGKDESFVG